MNSRETAFFIPLKLTNKAHDYAKRFAAEQATPEKARLVYLNTLAVYAVHSYLKWMEFESDLSKADSWNPGIRALLDVADLVIPGMGKLECRPMLPGETSIRIPEEVKEDRIGYIAVQFEEQLDNVKLLGFYPLSDTINAPNEIAVDDLKSFDDFIDYLEDLELFDSTNLNIVEQGKVILNQDNLGQWLENIFSETWLTVQEVLGEERTKWVFSARLRIAQAVMRASKIELKTQANSCLLALIIAVIPPKSEEKVTKICVQIHPRGNEIYLPSELKFVALGTSGEVIAEGKSGIYREWVQLDISGTPGEQFSVTIESNDAVLVRNFVI
jgi:Protein of unknown function (DUF1822)